MELPFDLLMLLINIHGIIIIEINADTNTESNPSLVYVKQGLEAVLECKVESSRLRWSVRVNNSWRTIADSNDVVNSTKYTVSANPSTGLYYRLHVLNTQPNDEGMYRCDGSNVIRYFFQLNLYEPPSRLYFHGPIDNKLEGTEGSVLVIRCIADGGKPPPDVSILDSTTPNGLQEVSYTILKISRDYHQKSIQCKATSDALDNPMKAAVHIYLNLKPLTPIFNTNEVSTEETVPLTVSCTSYGSRPAATFTWTIGGNDVTFSSTTSPPITVSNDTKTVTSTLAYNVNRSHNEQTIKCEAINTVGSARAIKKLDVTFIQDVTVENYTFHQSESVRNITCIAKGNPSKNTYYNWIHLSAYHIKIRELTGLQNSVLTLPSLPEKLRYQDNGVYQCTANNGMMGNKLKTTKSTYGFIKIIAKPIFTTENKLKILSEAGETISLNLYVYSEPKHSITTWYRNGSLVTDSVKYTMKEEITIVNEKFHGTDIQIDGYKISLTIKDTTMEDFSHYNIRLSNGIGTPAEHSLLLVHGSAPQSPINFTVVSIGQSSVTVNWKSADNGGYQQTFYLEYKVLASSIWIQREMPTTVYGGEFQSYELFGLQSFTFYNLRIFAANKMNKSLPSIILTTQTLKSGILDAENNFGNSVAIPVFAVGISCMLFTVSAWLIIGFICYRRKKLKTKRNKMESTGISFNKTMKSKEKAESMRPRNDQPGYEETSAAAYESLGMKDKPTIYSEIKG